MPLYFGTIILLRLSILKNRKQRAASYLKAAWHRLCKPKSKRVCVMPLVPENPYQSLMYSAWDSHVTSVDQNTALRMRKLGLLDTLHLHWDEYLTPINKPERASSTLTWLDNFRAHGGSIIWTMHNESPHRIDDEALLELFAQNRKEIIKRCDLIHVHSQTAKSILEQDYGPITIPISVIPHPSYIGEYDAPPNRQPNRKRNFLVFGVLHRSKGVKFILDGFREIQQRHVIGHLHFAGQGAAEIEAHYPNDIEVRATDGFISAAKVPIIFGEADFCVFGFSKTLTSGSLMLSITLGAPPIFPRFPSLVEEMNSKLLTLSYKPEDLEDFARVLAIASNMSETEYNELRNECLDMAQRLAPKDISKRLEKAILQA